MPNMSYCAFENTYNNLQQCIGLLEESTCGDLFAYAEEANQYEAPYITMLVELCQEIVDNYGGHLC